MIPPEKQAYVDELAKSIAFGAQIQRTRMLLKPEGWETYCFEAAVARAIKEHSAAPITEAVARISDVRLALR